MHIEHETHNYQWAYDAHYGVGRFIRKSDGAVSLLETGGECDELRENLRELFAGGFITANDIFDNIAGEYSYEDDKE